jgi:hypothetical protein
MLYDTSYRVPYDLEPGQMVYCPTNAPHRVENEDCLNISLTLDFLTEPIRRAQIVTLAKDCFAIVSVGSRTVEALKGHRTGQRPSFRRPCATALWIRQARLARRAVEFRLDRAAPGTVVDLIT